MISARENFTERQTREILYHSERAALLRKLPRAISYDVLKNPRSRWWNHYWTMYSLLQKLDLRGKSALVPGCGDGFDAMRLSKAGAKVHAFDISPDMLRLAEERAAQEGTPIEFRHMSCEHLSYRDNTFDLLFVHDVLHHCDLTKCLPEFVRVAKPGAYIIIDELYTHRALQRVRESRFGRWLQPKIVPYIYPFVNKDTYTTQDERKLSDADLFAIRKAATDARCSYFDMVVGRFVPSWEFAAKLDRIFLRLLGPAGYLLAGRFIIFGVIRK